MKKWILTLIFAAVVVLLFMWSIREHFDTYEDALKSVGQSAGYTDLTKPKCPSGYEYDSESEKCKSPSGEVAPTTSVQSNQTSTTSVQSNQTPANTCAQEISTKSWDEVSEECKKQAVNGPSDGTTSGSSTISQPNSGATTSSSSSNPQPSSRVSSLPMGVRKGNIWGPAYTGIGDNSTDDGLGSGTREYPTLFGPKPKESVMVEGGGISKPSIHTQLLKSGTLPSSSSTGSSEDSRFFGTSRSPGTSTIPGDQDMYPGFFGTFQSSKTDPVPFLSDFSAFLK
jgi:hypothetical protein